MNHFNFRRYFSEDLLLMMQADFYNSFIYFENIFMRYRTSCRYLLKAPKQMNMNDCQYQKQVDMQKCMACYFRSVIITIIITNPNFGIIYFAMHER